MFLPLAVLQRSSIRPNRQIATAPAQVTANSPDDHEPDGVEVESVDHVPHPARQRQPLGEHRQQLDRAHDQRDGDRQRGDDEVVVDPARRPRIRPRVGEAHERSVERVQQRHARREQHRQAEDRVERQAARGRARGEEQQRDLGGRVEAQPEQHADRVHLPGCPDRARKAGVEAAHQPAARKLPLQLLPVKGAAARASHHARDPDEDRDVAGRDQEQVAVATVRARVGAASRAAATAAWP